MRGIDNLKPTAGDGISVSGNKVSVNTTFNEASTRANINSGDTFATILGKIKKWFTDIPSLFVDKTGDTMTGNLTIKAALAVNRASTTQATFERDNSGTSSLSSIIYLGNNKAEGTAGCSDGVIRIYGKGSYYTTFEAPNSTANRKLTAPDKSGTIAVTSDLPMVGTVSLSRAAGNQSMIANITHPTLNPSNAYILVSVSNSSNIDAPFNLKTYPFASSYWTVDATRYSGTFASNATIEVTYQLIAP